MRHFHLPRWAMGPAPKAPNIDPAVVKNCTMTCCFFPSGEVKIGFLCSSNPFRIPVDLAYGNQPLFQQHMDQPKDMTPRPIVKRRHMKYPFLI